jgi:hypothetical protein
MIKITGADWERFYSDKDYWKTGYYHYDQVITVDGLVVDDELFDLDHVVPSAAMTVSGGDVYTPLCYLCSLEDYVKHWLKEQTTATFVVEVPKALEHIVVRAVINSGGLVL